MKKRFNLLAPALFALIASVLIFSWFREGFLYGGGDVGIPSYDPERIFEIVRFVWWSDLAPGITVPQGITSVPFQLAQSWLAKAGIPFPYIQAIFFWGIIFLTGYGMYLMAGTIFGEKRKNLAVLAGFFYQFNPYMMIEVWHRFIHNAFFLAAALPFIYLFWSKWIKEGLVSSLAAFLFISFLSSYMFGTLAFIAVILFVLLWIAAAEIFLPYKNYQYVKKISSRLFLGLFFWFLTQAWWMLPSFGIAPALLSVQHSVEGSLATLLSISEQTIIPYSIFGINPFYLYSNADFGAVYNSPYMRGIPFLSLLILFPAFIKSLKDKAFLAWGLLFAAGVFLSKGAAVPFGYAYIFGFSNIFSLGVLRNPFEKLGILIPFSGAILLALGVDYYTNRREKAIYFALGVLLFLLMGVFLWPAWSGKIFGTYEKPPYVEVPQSYIEADKYIKAQGRDGNILHLPLSTNEAATYYWEHGFSGVESSQLYFNSLSSVSRGFNIPHIDDALTALSGIFTANDAQDMRIIELLRAFNIRFIILHKDMEWRGGLLPDPEVLEKKLNSKIFLNKERTFGPLMLYQLNPEIFAPKLRLSEKIQYLNPGKENSYLPWLIKEDEGDFLTPADKKADSSLMNQSSRLIVLPEDVYSYSGHFVSAKDAIGSLAATKILPDSPFYFLVNIKEGIKLFSITQTEKSLYRVDLAGKRLAEAFRIKEKNTNVPVVPLLKRYQKYLYKIGSFKGISTPLDVIFARHFSVLDYLISSSDGEEKETALESKKILAGKLRKDNILPEFEIKTGEDLSYDNRLISAFQVPFGGKFELMMDSQNGRNFYKDDLMKMSFQIDDSLDFRQGLLKEHFISYGTFEFGEGLHELSFNSALSENMLKNAGIGHEFELASEMKTFIDFEPEPVTGGGWYRLSFDSHIQTGDMFKVQLIQDSDPTDSGPEGRFMSFNKKFLKSREKGYWNRYEESLNIRPKTEKAKIRFLIEPAKEASFAAVLRNIEIKRVLRNPLILRSDAGQKDTGEGSILEFTGISPVLYKGKISTKASKFLIFAESFHNGWTLKLNDGKNEISLEPKYLANLYSNAWLIEKPGSYTFSLEFAPQKQVEKGIAVSIAGFLGVFLLWSVRRKI